MSTSTQNLEGAHDFVINHPQFIENQTIHNAVLGEAGSGLKTLLEASTPDAFHDSSARHPPPRCHPGTRESFIGKITAWGLCTSGQEECILWMHGPAGVGKSAVAQSCADLLAEKEKLGAAFFFSRPNWRDNSNHFFTSVSYQIAMSHEAYGHILDLKLRKDPTLVKKSITQQFQELLVKPIQELRAQGEDLGRRVIIVDGLDECTEHRAQQEIVEIVAASIQNNTTPFLWAFFSRPETHIIASFTSDDVSLLSHHIELPVSRAIDHEILCYLTDELKKVQRERNLPSSWPPEQQIGILVDLSGGLFIYAATVVRFIRDPNSLGPDTQLAAILSLATIAKENAGSEHPLTELDLFYMLILRSIPPKILPVILNILLLNSLGLGVVKSANILGLSQTQYLGVCGILQSVFRIEPTRRPDWGYNFNWCRQDLSPDEDMEIVFYHASFMEFMQNIKRSKDLCVYSDCLDALRHLVVERLSYIHSRSAAGSIAVNFSWDALEFDKSDLYDIFIDTMVQLLEYDRPLDPLTVTALLNFNFRMIPRLTTFLSTNLSPERLRKKIPSNLRGNIIRRAYLPRLEWYTGSASGSLGRPYILGQGENRIVIRKNKTGQEFVPYDRSLVRIV